MKYELQHDVLASPLRRRGSSVYVTLPVDSIVLPSGELKRRKIIYHSFRALAAVGVEGVVMEVWWGLVEKDSPGEYNWRGYFEILTLARSCRLKVKAVLAFHQGDWGTDCFRIPLPEWVLKQMEKDEGLAYSDRFGRRSKEYISLGCDNLPVLCGRSPIQAYADFMRNFRDTFQQFFGGVITGIQIGMGPGGELRYPSNFPQQLTWVSSADEVGEFQCYDKYMQASLNACAMEVGMPHWGNGGPVGGLITPHDPELTNFFRSDGSWNTPYGKFFLEWYSGLLVLHGERICREAVSIFHGPEVTLSGKVASMHWHYSTVSHPSELTAGYYNTLMKNGYIPIASMFARHGFTMCCTGFEMKDSEQNKQYRFSSPEGFLRQLILAARVCDVPVEGENSGSNLDEISFQQMLNMSRFCSDSLEKSSFSFNFNRLGKDLFERHNFSNFANFVREISNLNTFRAKRDFGGDDMNQSSLFAAAISGAVLA